MCASEGLSVRRAITVAVLLWGFASGSTARGATITAALVRDTIYEGEAAEVAVTVQNPRGAEVPSPPEVVNLTIRQTQSESRTTIINGALTSSRVYRYAVEPATTGEFTIPPFSLEVDGTTLSTRPLRLRVLPGQNPAINQIAFLQLKTEKQRVYVGEGLPVEIRVAWRAGEFSEAPRLEQEGLTTGRWEQLQRTRELFGGIVYVVDPFRTYVVAARAGTLKLGPATLPFGVPVRSRLGFPSGNLMRVELQSPVINLEVLPLPAAGVPKGFTGAVGKYTMAVEASTNAVIAGDPILITVDIRGEGPIESIQLESYGDVAGFKTYAPEISVELQDKLGLLGRKRFTQVVIPQSHEVKELPPIQFGFFDPERQSYQALVHGPMPITVRHGAVVAAYPEPSGDGARESEQSEAAREIVHIKDRMGSYGAIQPPLVLRPWFLGMQAVPVVAWLGATLWRWRQNRLAGDPRLRRRRQVARVVREGLVELRRAADRDDAEAFFATVFRLLQERLGEKTGLPTPSIDELSLDQVLNGKVGEGLLAEVHGLFQECSLARYAPGRLSQGLSSYIPRVRSVLDRLKEVEGP